MAWKELRLPIAEYLAQTQPAWLTREEQGRLALAWPVVWIGDDASEAAWRRALGYAQDEWPAARDRWRDVLEREDGRWSLPWMRAEALRQMEFREQQAEYGRRGGLAKASRALGEPSAELGPARVAQGSARLTQVTSSPASASASTPRSSRSRSSRNGSAPEPAYTPEFEAFWAEYRCERRRGKPEAFREYLSAGGPRIHQDVMNALTVYKSTREWREGFMPEPARWLKKRPWDGPVPQEEAPW